MAVHAAMVDRMDQGIGELIDALEKNNQLDNTLILFCPIMVVVVRFVKTTAKERMTVRI